MSPSHLPRRRPPTLAILLSLTLVILLPLLVPGASRAAPDGPPGLVLIMDASQSMATKIQGKPRMDGARTAVADLIGGLPTGIEVGLVAFGHRQADECNDVEVLAPLGPPDRPALIGKLQGLTPTGKAPLRDALQAAAAGLKDRSGKTTIVLVTDGADRCGGDPCAQVKELKAAGTRFVLNVVGLGVTAKERGPLACMAAAGGGTYFGAKTAADFKRVLTKALARTVTPTGNLRVKALRDGQPLPAWYDLYAADSARGPGQAPLASNPIGDQGEAIKLVPGTYDLVVRNQEARATPGLTFNGLTIAPGKTLEQAADFTVGRLTVRAQRNSRPFNASYQLMRSGAAATGSSEPLVAGPLGIDGATIELLAGTYDLVIEDLEDLGQPVRRFTDIVIEPGKGIEKTGRFAGGTLKVVARRGGLPVKARYEIRTPGTADAEPQPIASDPIAAEGQRILLPPGTYDLRVRNLEDRTNPVIDFPGVVIEAARTVERHADF
jgi:hypothetical protein